MIRTGEEIFSISADAFAVSPSAEGYTLNYSVDGQNWVAYGEATPANETLLVKNTISGLMYKLAGNNSTVIIKF